MTLAWVMVTVVMSVTAPTMPVAVRDPPVRASTMTASGVTADQPRPTASTATVSVAAVRMEKPACTARFALTSSM